MSHAKRDALGLLGMVALLAIAISVVCSNRQKPLPVSDEAARAVVGEVATATTLPDSTGHSASITMYPLTNPQAYEAFAWKPSGPIIKRASESVGDSTLGMVPRVRVMQQVHTTQPPAHSARETPKELLDPLTPEPYVMSPGEAVTSLQRTAVVASQQGYRIKGGLAAFSAFGIWFRSGYPFDQVVVFDWLLNGRRTTYARVQWLDGAMQGVRTDLIACGFQSPDAIGVKARHIQNGYTINTLGIEATD